jgi:SAM-dependent methyltransferase
MVPPGVHGNRANMVTRELEAFVRAALAPPPLRVLEIGAGRGEVAVALRDAGYEITAVDPAAEPGGIVQRCSLLEVRGSFDVAVSIVALHHVNPLEESCAHLATMLPTGGQLVVDEIDIDRYDDRAIAWWSLQRQALGVDEHGHAPSDILGHLREHIHPLDRMLAALAPYFDLGRPVPGPYLHRWELSPSLYAAEVDLIASGLVPAVGCRLIATRK